MQALRKIFGVQSSSEFHDHGLRLLVPDVDDPEELQRSRSIDIVFVHGLTGTWDGTWTGETSDGQKVLWPRNLLKERFPTARIFSFGYDANAVNLAHRVSTQSITQHANDLLVELETIKRETGTQEYKLVFAVHSLGGLVVQKMLSLSKNHYEAHYQRIESLTIGAAFFGTPMLGADLAAWASIGTALSSVLKQTNRDIVGVLKPDSSMAANIRLDITNLVARRAYTGNPIKIACFYECLPVPGYGRVVVNDKSATWPPHYQKGIQADHMNMTKFASTQERGYRDFIGEVGRWVDENEGERCQPSDLLGRLDFAERMARQQQIDDTDALESTLDWVWSKDHEKLSSFAQWLLGDQAVFWIQDSRENLSSKDELRRLEARFGNGKADTWASSTLKTVFVHALLQTSVNLCILVDGLDELSENLPELLTFLHKLPSRTDTGNLLKMCLASRPNPVVALALGERPGVLMQAHNANAIKQYAFNTMESLGVAANNRTLLERLSRDLAVKAEGVFLWVRFAAMEVVNGHAEGENDDELNQRLEALPSDMFELYTNILSRMTPRDQEEARLMFQLVCFARSDHGSSHVGSINLRILKEAVAIAQNNVAAPSQSVSVNELERFRKRFKAKSGGLLEEVYEEVSDRLTSVGKARERFKKNGGRIALIHRTAETYLHRQGWFLGQDSSKITSPHASWLHVCCRSIQSKLKPRESQLQHSEPAELKIDGPTRSSLCGYASQNLFYHARVLEFEYQESSFPFLQIISPTMWRYLRKQYRIQLDEEFEERCSSFDWDTIDKLSDRQPGQIIVEQGLHLSLRDAALKHYYAPPSEGEDLSLALLHAQRLPKGQTFSDKTPGNMLPHLLSCLVDLGAVVHQRHILECLYVGHTEGLGTLLASWPEEKIRLKRDTLSLSKVLLDLQSGDAEQNHTYNGESVGILWEFVRASLFGLSRSDSDAEAMLCLLLERGESLDDVCGPGGTALHGCIIGGHTGNNIRFMTNISLLKVILRHGADPNVSGPRGTPLQLAWRTFHSLSYSRWKCHIFRHAMELLLEYGADPNWVEPNGIAIDRGTIEAWCAMSDEEMHARWQDDDYPFCRSSWYTYEFPLYRSARYTGEARAISAD